jgi:hypothetical protein
MRIHGMSLVKNEAERRLKHYQYRSPQQIQRPIESRPKAPNSFRHELLPDWKPAIFRPLEVDFAAADAAHAPTTWRDRIVEASLLNEDRGDYVVAEATLPPIPRARPAWVKALRAGARRAKRSLRRSH